MDNYWSRGELYIIESFLKCHLNFSLLISHNFKYTHTIYILHQQKSLFTVKYTQLIRLKVPRLDMTSLEVSIELDPSHSSNAFLMVINMSKLCWNIWPKKDVIALWVINNTQSSSIYMNIPVPLKKQTDKSAILQKMKTTKYVYMSSIHITTNIFFVSSRTCLHIISSQIIGGTRKYGCLLWKSTRWVVCFFAIYIIQHIYLYSIHWNCLSTTKTSSRMSVLIVFFLPYMTLHPTKIGHTRWV